ncbi:hypothetical protein ACSXCI_14710 [Clostridium perfringens]
MLKDILSEYTDEIICSEGVNYTSSLVLISSDFSVVIADEELSKIIYNKEVIVWIKKLKRK